MGKLIDLTGQRFGRLSVIERAENNKYNQARWRCVCDCGKERVVIGQCLLRGATKSCGCYSRNIGERMRSHEGYKERLYAIWSAMLQRCENPNNDSYKHYGGRGISVCKEWHDYVAFRAWAMGAGYDPEAHRGTCTIDRIDVDGNYEPSNCRWVDMKTQANNTRRSKAKGAG